MRYQRRPLNSTAHQYNRCIISSTLIYINIAVGYATDIDGYRQRSSLAACALSYFTSNDITSLINPNKNSNCQGTDDCNNRLLDTNNDWNTSSEQCGGAS